MSINRKQDLPVQFLKFGVDSFEIHAPIFRRARTSHAKRLPASKSAASPNPGPDKPR
jgi:hypothetical protein